MGVDPGSIGFLAAAVLGLSFGAGACTLTCLPYVGPLMLGGAGDSRSAWRIAGVFSLGRLAGYVGLGAAAGMLGAWVEGWLEHPLARLALAAVVLWLALGLWRRRHAGCVTGRMPGVRPPERIGPGTRGPSAPGVFLLGAGMAVTPCLPLATVIAAAAASGTLIGGSLLGLGFGLGAVVIPGVILGFGLGRVSVEIRRQLQRWRPFMERGSAVMLVAMALATGLGWGL